MPPQPVELTAAQERLLDRLTSIRTEITETQQELDDAVLDAADANATKVAIAEAVGVTQHTAARQIAAARRSRPRKDLTIQRALAHIRKIRSKSDRLDLQYSEHLHRCAEAGIPAIRIAGATGFSRQTMYTHLAEAERRHLQRQLDGSA